MDSGWAIYDRLLSEVPSDQAVKAILVGRFWTLVDAGGAGFAMTFAGDPRRGGPTRSRVGDPLDEVASLVKSWDIDEASIGMAAMNAHFNSPDLVAGWVRGPLESLRSPGAFTSLADEMAGRRVAVVGHFPGLESLADRCSLTVLEREPQPGDLPDFAAEYVLPEQDFVLVTGTTIINKTLPRLLELSAGAKVALVGPSVPLTPLWFGLGVDVLAGAVVLDKGEVWTHCAEGGHRGLFDRGAMMIDIRASDLADGVGHPPADSGSGTMQEGTGLT